MHCSSTYWKEIAKIEPLLIRPHYNSSNCDEGDNESNLIKQCPVNPNDMLSL